jgi:hypothetical protein
MDGTEINCIVPAIKWNLKLKVIPVILRSISNFADKLGHVGMGLTTLLSCLTSFDEITIF